MPAETGRMFDEVYAVMSEPGFAADNDGYALPSLIGRNCVRSLGSINRALEEGERVGRFASRPHATMVASTTRKPLREYKAL